MGAGQWKQLDESVNTVIKKHKNVKKYFISIPIDPADAKRDDQTSLQEKWDDHVEKWNEWAEKESLKIEFIPWWASDLINRLQKPENSGLTYFWFNKQEFTDEWFKKNLEIATSDLGERYNPEINFELEIAKIFDGIARDEKFEEQFKNSLNKFIIKLKSNKFSISDKIIEKNKEKLQENIGFLVKEYSNIPFNNVDPVNYSTGHLILK